MTAAQARHALLPYLPRVRSLRAAKVLLALLLHSNARGESWPSGAALARATGLPVRGVWAGLRELEVLGLVARVSRGHGRANLYQVLPCGSPPGVTRTAQDSDARVSRIVTQESRGSDSRVTGIVTPESPPPIVTGGSLSERPKPRHKRVSAQGGARRNSDPWSTQNKEQIKEQIKEQQPSAGSPPAYPMASGEPAYGLGEHPGEAPPAPTSVAGRLVDIVLDHAPFVSGYGAVMLGLGDLRALRAHLETVRPDLAGQFTAAVSAALGGRERLREAVREAEAGGVGQCWNPRVGRVVLVTGYLSSFLRGVLDAWAGLLQPGPPQQGQAMGPLHEVPDEARREAAGPHLALGGGSWWSWWLRHRLPHLVRRRVYVTDIDGLAWVPYLHEGREKVRPLAVLEVTPWNPNLCARQSSTSALQALAARAGLPGFIIEVDHRRSLFRVRTMGGTHTSSSVLPTRPGSPGGSRAGGGAGMRGRTRLVLRNRSIRAASSLQAEPGRPRRSMRSTSSRNRRSSSSGSGGTLAMSLGIRHLRPRPAASPGPGRPCGPRPGRGCTRRR
jgi:hypothetical protein